MIDVTAFHPKLLKSEVLPAQNGAPANALVSLCGSDQFPALRMYFSDADEMKKIGMAMIKQAEQLKKEQSK